MNQKILSICAVLTALLMLNGIGAADNTQPMTLEERVTALEKGGGGKSAVNAVWDKGLKFKSADGGKTLDMAVGGRLMWDLQFVSQSDKLKTSLGAAAAGTNTDQARFRRARFHMEGTVDSRFLFKLEIDFAGGAVAFKDAYLGLKSIPVLGTLKLGSMKETFTMEELTSSKYITFVERSMINSFSPQHSVGFQISNHFKPEGDEVDRLQWALGVYRDVGNSGDDVGAGKNGKYNWTARISGVPFYRNKGEQLIHLGGSVSIRNPNTFTGGVQTVAYSARPEVSMGPTLVATGNVQAGSVTLYGIELAGVFNQLWFMGEYVGVNTSKPDGSAAQDASFNGFYFASGFFLTGENRPYKASAGAFDRVKPKQNAFSDNGEGGTGMGAFEIAARYGMIDLEDTDAGVFGGQLSAVTVAFNWYLTPNFRYMLNYVHADLDREQAAPPNLEGGEDLLTMRFGCDW